MSRTTRQFTINLSLAFLTRDPVFTLLKASDDGREAFTAFLSLVGETLNLGQESGVDLSLLSAAAYPPDEIRRHMSTIRKACQIAGVEYWGNVRSDSFEFRQPWNDYTNQGGSREGSGRKKSKGNQSAIKDESNAPLLDIGIRDSESLSQGGECEGGTPDPFDVAWSAWPRKVGKKDAKRAWDKSVASGRDPCWLRDRVRDYAQSAESKRNASTNYHPHLSTWLNKERYNDDDASWNTTDDREASGRSDADRGTSAQPQPRQLRRA